MSAPRLLLVVTLTAAALGACNSSTAPSAKGGRPFSMSLVSSADSVAPGLVVTGIRLAVGRAALGGGSEFGCKDCTGTETEGPAAVTIVKLDGAKGTATLAAEPAQPGTYSEAEIELLRPGSAAAGVTPAWPDTATIEITGTSKGAPFTLAIAAEGSLRQTLASPVVVRDTASTVAPVTLVLPVATWFHSGTQALDPANSAGAAQIAANVRASLQPVEAPGAPEAAIRKP